MPIPIRIGHMTTSRAPLTRVLGVYLQHVKTLLFGLVRDKALKLVKSPSVVKVAVFFSACGRLTNPGQILQYDQWVPCLKGELNDAATHDVIHVAHVPRLLPAQPFQQAPDRPTPVSCLLPLELGAEVFVMLSLLFYFPTTKELAVLPVSDDGKIVLSPINADYGVVRALALRRFRLERDRKIYVSVSNEHFCVPEIPILSEVLKAGRPVKLNGFLSPVNCPNREPVAGKPEVSSSFAALKLDGSIFTEGDLPVRHLAKAFVAGFHVTNRALRDLRRKIRHLTDSMIGLVVQIAGRERSFFEVNFADIVARLRPRLLRLVNNLGVEVRLNGSSSSYFHHAMRTAEAVGCFGLKAPSDGRFPVPTESGQCPRL